MKSCQFFLNSHLKVKEKLNWTNQITCDLLCDLSSHFMFGIKINACVHTAKRRSISDLQKKYSQIIKNHFFRIFSHLINLLVIFLLLRNFRQWLWTLWSASNKYNNNNRPHTFTTGVNGVESKNSTYDAGLGVFSFLQI